MDNHFDENAERSVLGAILIDKNCIINVYEHLEPRDLYNNKHAKIYEAMISLFARGCGIDVITVSDELERLKYTVSNYEIVSLAEAVPSSANIESYLEIVKNYSKARQLEMILNKTKVNPHEPLDDQILKVQEDLIRISDLRSDRDIDFYTEINKANDLLNKRLNGEKKIIGYNWSSNKLTELSGGIEIPYVYIFGALKKTGKSKFLIDQLHSLYKQGVPTLFLSLEMGKSQVARWIWSRFAEVDSMKIRYPVTQDNNKNLNNGELVKLSDARKEIEQLNKLLIVNTESFLDLPKIRAKIYQAINKIGVKVILLDHLQRCNIPNRNKQNDAKAIEEFVYRFADMGKEYNVASILLSQLSNVAEGEFATIRHLKHSGGIAEGVDFIGVMNRESRVKRELANSNKILVGCWQRDGKSDEIEIECDLTTGRFEDNLTGF